MDHERNISKWLVVILVLLILLGGGYWFYLNKKTTDLTYDKTDGKVAVPEVVKNEPVSNLDENISKYYFNKDFGFSFNYPENLELGVLIPNACSQTQGTGKCENMIHLELTNNDNADFLYFEITKFSEIGSDLEMGNAYEGEEWFGKIGKERDFIKNSNYGLVNIEKDSDIPFGLDLDNGKVNIISINGVKFVNFYGYDKPSGSLVNEYHGFNGNYMVNARLVNSVATNDFYNQNNFTQIHDSLKKYEITGLDPKNKDQFNKFDQVFKTFTFASIPLETSLAVNGLKSFTNKNDNFNFSFNYPESWGEISLGSGSAETGVTRSLDFSNKSGIFMGYASSDFSAGRSGYSYELGAIGKDSLKYSSCEAYKDSSDLTTCENLLIDGKNMGIILKIDKTNLGETVINGPSIEIYYVTGNEKFPIIGVETDSSSVDDKEIIEVFKSIKLN